MLRVAILAGSALGGLLAARRSIASRERAEQEQREYAYEARTGHDPSSVAWQPAPTPLPAALPSDHDVHAAGSGQERGAVLLLGQVALSILLMALAPLLRPAAVGEVAWMQLVASVCFTALAAALAASFYSLGAVRRGAPPAVEAAVPAGTLLPLEALNGVWIKDKELSDSLEPACDLVNLHGIVRVGIGLIKGAEIRVAAGEEFSFAAFSGIAWFRITERYPLGAGSVEQREVRNRRRDLRRGGELGSAEEAPCGGVRLRNRWGDPYSGTCDELFHCPQPGVLHVDATITVGERKVQYRQVYRRRVAK